MRRLLVMVSCATVALSLSLTPAGTARADAAVTLGRTATTSGGGSCNGGPDLEAMQFSTSSGMPTTAPFAGVITSWSFAASTVNTTLTLRMFRNAGANSFTAIADGGPLRTVLANSGLHTFPARITVQRGDFVGLRSTAGECATPTANPNDTYRLRAGAVTPLGASAVFGPGGGGFVWNIEATLERDADGDGFGDISQDQCPTSAATQGRCDTSAPETKVTKKPKPRSGISTLSFTSSDAGSTFTCKIDGKKAKPCTSPTSYVCLKPGKHTFTVAATDPAGNVDTTPAVKKFKLKPQRKGC
jgi:hypothetical protein